MWSLTGGLQRGKAKQCRPAVRALCAHCKVPISGSHIWRHCFLKVMQAVSMSLTTEKDADLAHRNHLGSL